MAPPPVELWWRRRCAHARARAPFHFTLSAILMTCPCIVHLPYCNLYVLCDPFERSCISIFHDRTASIGHGIVFETIRMHISDRPVRPGPGRGTDP